MSTQFPSSILVPKVYKDKGEQITGEVATVNSSYEILLATFAKRRETTLDGRVLSSSIFVNLGGDTYTEVFSTPVPAGNYFYSYDATDTTHLSFNSTHTQSIPLNVSYVTRGDLITAARATQVETDIAAIETALGVKTAVLQYGIIPAQAGPVTVTIDTSRIAPAELAAATITVLLTATDGTSGHPFSFTGSNAGVTIVTGGSEINYLFIVHKS
jgi:hypothetical protein